SRTTSEMRSLRERFTLQAGAFRNRDGAESAKVQLEEQPGINKLGTANIRTRTDRRGDTLYLVQIGSFSTRSAADAARRGMDAVEFVVVAQ
ncbi:MAG: SPOR domain-containing protein, partial [Phycisphaerales bacterium]|nr:SPOR domain-containing protein [Phycisphaerales bacterium]